MKACAEEASEQAPAEGDEGDEGDDGDGEAAGGDSSERLSSTTIPSKGKRVRAVCGCGGTPSSP